MISYLDKFKRAIPNKLIDKIIQVVRAGRTDLRKSTSINGDRLIFLFEVYNKYLIGTKTENINCGGCRVRVWSRLDSVVKQLEAEGWALAMN